MKSTVTLIRKILIIWTYFIVQNMIIWIRHKFSVYMTIKKLENFLLILFRQNYEIFHVSSNWKQQSLVVEWQNSYWNLYDVFQLHQSKAKQNKQKEKLKKTKQKTNKQAKKQTKQSKDIKQRWDETYSTEFFNDAGFTIVGT